MPSKRRRGRKKQAVRKSSSVRDTISRALLGRELQRQIRRFGLSRELAGVVVGDAASQMSRLMTSHFADFSADRMVKMLTRLGSDVTITISHAKRLGRRGKVRVLAR
jgi:predicted XRE-type DNA-binding protein